MATTSRRTRKATTAPVTPADIEATDPATTDPETTDAPAEATSATPDPTGTEPTAGPATTDTAAEPAPASDTTDTPAEAPVSGAPVSGAPVSGAPVGGGDHLKVVMVAGILGDHPDGVTASGIVDESGLRAAIVGRVLAAMETAGAAVRKPATTDDGGPDPAGAELWVRGDADLTTVDLTAAAVRVVCPTCQRPMPRRTGVAVVRTGPVASGHNSDGQRTLGKNELRTIVRDFLAAHPGHEFTPTTISREIGRSSGAIGNALDKLVLSGEAILVKDAPRIYTAPADTAPDGAKAPTGK
jgi:hypothetical protein